MIAIPQVLDGCRFIRVAPKDKKAIDPSWQKWYNFGINDEPILNHLDAGANYGVMPDNGISVLDIDDVLSAEGLGIIDLFADTFRVKTGSGYHFYFRIIGDFQKEKIPFYHPEDRKKHIGELYPAGSPAYVCGPGSIHPSGSRYEVVKDIPLKEISAGDIRDHLLSKVYYSKKDQTEQHREPRPANTAGSLTDALGLSVIDMMPPIMDKGSVRTGTEVKGSHPVHGSSSGNNYSVNLKKNQWFCHRCQSGGGPLEALAVREGLISCDQAGKAEIKGDLFKRLKTILAEKEGYAERISELDHSYKKHAENKPEPKPVYGNEEDVFDIIRSGKVLDLFRQTFSTLHSGDRELCDLITLAGAAGAAKTTKGIQPGFSGSMGAGKTSGTIAALHLWPEEYVISGGMSAKALFYRENFTPGSVVFSDDTYIEGDLLQTVKSAMSTFQLGAEHHSVTKVSGTLTGISKKIPERTTFIFTSIDDSGDQELADRQYKLSLNPDEQKKLHRVEFLLQRIAAGREELPRSPEVLLCRQVLRTIKDQIFRVYIPYARRLEFSNLDNMRDIEIFLDFIQGVCILNFPNRNPVQGEEGIVSLTATEEDFHTALSIFKSADDTREFKLTKNERALLDWLCEINLIDGIPETRITGEYAARYKISRTAARRLLYGRDGSASNVKGGLLAKVPGVDVEHQNIKSDADADVRVNMNIIRVSPGLKTNLDHFQRPFCTLKPEPGKVSNSVIKDSEPLNIQKEETEGNVEVDTVTVSTPDSSSDSHEWNLKPDKDENEHSDKTSQPVDTTEYHSEEEWRKAKDIRYELPPVSSYTFVKKGHVSKCIVCGQPALKDVKGSHGLCQDCLQQREKIKSVKEVSP